MEDAVDYCFGVVWIVEVCNAIQTFVVSYATVKWFALPMPKRQIVWLPVAQGVVACVVFHLGSVAFGSFLIATTRVIILITSLVARYADSEGNALLACIAQVCMGCVVCFRRCLEYVNKNAYCDIAIRSGDFWVAAKRSTRFMTSSAPDIAILQGACWFSQFAGISLVTTAGAGLAYLAVTEVDRWSSPESGSYVEDPLVVCAVVGAICFSISAVCLSLFDDIADSMLYCYAVAREQGVASTYAPETLRSLAAGHEGGSSRSLHRRTSSR
ncbi:unnamed protein product [Prorocentrum cordatum]|uniref:Choline transporter-like protein n=1 Tax=Prorocentrum cordatum TaxID=2364126 RepID=A0ABN9VJ89_9DINO|nr:unnamed protein product [Polarella glacialis]